MDASVSDADATKIPKAESASQDQSLADETGTDFFYFSVYLSRSIHNFSRLFAIPRMNVSDCSMLKWHRKRCFASLVSIYPENINQSEDFK